MRLNNGLARLWCLFHEPFLIQKSKYVGYKEVGMLIKELIGDCFFTRYIGDPKWSEFKVDEVLDKSYSVVQNGPDKLALSIAKMDESIQLKSGIYDWCFLFKTIGVKSRTNTKPSHTTVCLSYIYHSTGIITGLQTDTFCLHEAKAKIQDIY